MDVLQKVGAAILAAEASWNPKTASESKERVMARAAIEAIAEPSDEMIRAGQLCDDESYADCESHYRAMIDAALSPRHDLDDIDHPV